MTISVLSMCNFGFRSSAASCVEAVPLFEFEFLTSQNKINLHEFRTDYSTSTVLEMVTLKPEFRVAPARA
jgi:hypothetical protein